MALVRFGQRLLTSWVKKYKPTEPWWDRMGPPEKLDGWYLWKTVGFHTMVIFGFFYMFMPWGGNLDQKDSNKEVGRMMTQPTN